MVRGFGFFGARPKVRAHWNGGRAPPRSGRTADHTAIRQREQREANKGPKHLRAAWAQGLPRRGPMKRVLTPALVALLFCSAAPPAEAGRVRLLPTLRNAPKRAAATWFRVTHRGYRKAYRGARRDQGIQPLAWRRTAQSKQRVFDTAYGVAFGGTTSYPAAQVPVGRGRVARAFGIHLVDRLALWLLPGRLYAGQITRIE